MKNHALLLSAAAFAAVVAAVLAYFAYQLGVSLLTNLFGDWRQMLVALIAAGVMATVGFNLTMGKGKLAQAGQTEKIAVWAALLMSIVSAITTSLGLLSLLSANPSTGAVLMVGMALMLALGIQLSMLMYALQIGDGIQRLNPIKAQAGDDDDADLFDDDVQSRGPSLIKVGAVVVVLLAGVYMLFGQTISGLILDAVDSIIHDPLSQLRDPGTGPKILAPVFIIIGLLAAIRIGLLPRPGTFGAIAATVLIYGTLLLFSSGFGYLAYLTAAQSDIVRATDRDNRIETETPAFVRRINQAAFDDTNDALVKATEGPEFQALSTEVDALSSLFVKNRAKLEDQVAAFENRRLQIEAAQDAAQQSISDGEVAVREAELALEQAKAQAKAAEDEMAQRLGILNPDLAAARKGRDDAAAGRDTTGVAACGSICKRFQAQVDRIEADIQQLQGKRSAANLALSRAQSELIDAKRRLERAKRGENGDLPDLGPPPSVIDRSSFTLPRNEYRTNPTIDGLRRLAVTCSIAVDMLISVDVSPRNMPRCDIARVEAALRQHQELTKAQDRMVDPCTRTDAELQAEDTALKTSTIPDINQIPSHLQARIAWVSRCLTAANTGSERMEQVARDVNRFESEFIAAGYDPRRALRSLEDRDRFAIFAALMALIVDLAILFAGFFANAFRSQVATNDPAEQHAGHVVDAIDQALSAIFPNAPGKAAAALSAMWVPVSPDDAGNRAYTRKIVVADHSAKAMNVAKLILDAAGPVLVRYSEQDGKDKAFWLLHQNFVQLINKHATQSPIPADEVLTLTRSDPYSATARDDQNRRNFALSPSAARTMLPHRPVEPTSVAPAPEKPRSAPRSPSTKEAEAPRKSATISVFPSIDFGPEEA